MAKRKNPVIFAEIPTDLKDWLDSLPGEGEKPNRSLHIRRALRLYKRGGPEKVRKLLAELEKSKTPSPDELRGRWMSSLSPEIQVRVWEIGEALRAWAGGAPPPAIGTPELRRKARRSRG